MVQCSAIINVMVKAAEKAGRALARDFGEVENLQTSKKGPADFVSIADTKAEKTLMEELAHARPNYGFICEESGVIEGADPHHRWIVDPLDGTTNFLHGIPIFAISIALQKDINIIAGVVYNPVTQELFFAERGQGAFMNDRRIRVSSRTQMINSLYGTGLPFAGKAGYKRAMHELDAVLQRSSGVRRMGAASLDLAFVASGRLDGYWEWGLNPWDIAAGIILVRESGGTVDTITGSGDPVEGQSIIAANESSFRSLKKVLKDVKQGKAFE